MAETSDSGKDTEVTMMDVLKQEMELEDDANAVLGGSDDTNCSYDMGYVPRQALYACKTCKINGEAGVCLACCYACHDGHEVVELYTKRNFRCDCGNSKFEDKKCTLRSAKDPVNISNVYNHNFQGLYCSCSRPYPDLEDDTPDEMIQCIFCEDWYHGRHLGSSVPEEFLEMICEKCMQSHKFLYSYQNKYNELVDVDTIKKESPKKCNGESSASKSTLVEQETKPEVDKKPTEDKGPSGSTTLTSSLPDTNGKSEDNCKDDNPTEMAVETKPTVSVEALKADEVSGSTVSSNPTSSLPDTNGKSQDDCKDDKSAGMEVETKPTVSIEAIKADEDKPQPIKDEPIGMLKNGDAAESCLLETLNGNPNPTGSAFWPTVNWRQELCRCAKCMKMYADMKCEFLLDSSDTIQAYEDNGKGRSGQSQYDKGLSALGKLDRVKQMEVVRAYTSMGDQLREYLKEFVDNKRTVCESDITEFFERIGKKQKLNDGVPHFCR